MSGQRAISDLAYGLWQARGCPEGSSEVDWMEAERQVLGRRPDVPPGDAADKWTEAKEIAGRDDAPND